MPSVLLRTSFRTDGTPEATFSTHTIDDRLPVPNATSVSRRAIIPISIYERTKGRHPVAVERVVGLERLETGTMMGWMIEKTAVGLKVRMTFRRALLMGLRRLLLRGSWSC